MPHTVGQKYYFHSSFTMLAFQIRICTHFGNPERMQWKFSVRSSYLITATIVVYNNEMVNQEKDNCLVLKR